MTIVITDGTLIGGSPALIVDSGVVILVHVTAMNATDAPTILVTGGHLVVRDSTTQESTGHADAAIEVHGGTVDLGTDAATSGNTINVNGAGSLILNATATAISALGVSFTINGVPLAASSLSGVLFNDFNDDGQVDFGELGIAAVTVTLDGADFLGNPVDVSQSTDGDGAYVFLNLRPGNYTITETQPAGYT